MAEEEIHLEETSVPAYHQYAGTKIISGATAGQSLRIETSPDGIELLDFELPEGGDYYIKIDVLISEKLIEE